MAWLAFMSLEKGEQHRRQFQAELDSGRWDFGDQPALLAVAQGIVKNDPEAIRAAAKSVPDLQTRRTRRCNVAQLRCETIVAATRIRRGSSNVAVTRSGSELHKW